MSRRPRRVSGLRSTVAIARIELTWDSLGFDPLIDHYRVHGVPGRGMPFTPDDDNLLARTLYPQWLHGGLDFAGEDWSYQIIPVSAAGQVAVASRTHTASSIPSVTASGAVELVRAGDFDATTLEVQYAPSSYTKIPETYPDAVFEHRTGDDLATTWPYLLPGPNDEWADNRVYRHRWTFTVEELQADPVLVLWLVDTTRLASTLEIMINDQSIEDRTLPPGGTRGSSAGDATADPLLIPSYHEFDVDHRLFSVGTNTIEFSIADGGWLAWDAVALYRR